MRTDALAVLCLTALVLAAGAGSAAAQEIRVDRDTQVRSVRFEIEGAPGPEDLAEQIATKGRGGMTGLRHALRWVPFVPGVPDRPFDPIELQRDKERLRRHFARRGYPEAVVAYDVVRDADENLVDVTFRIESGAPLIVSRVDVEWDPSGPSPYDAALRVLSDITAPVIAIHEGVPLDESTIPPSVASIRRWLEDRGYAFATVDPDVVVDSVLRTADVTFRTHAGPRTRIGEIAIEGNTTVPTRAIRELLEIRSGDWYSPTRLESAGQRIATLDVISRATFRAQPAAAGDTVIDLVLQVGELPPRRILGEAGYTTDGGIAGHATWTHSSIFGGAQALTADVAGQSGLFAINDNPDKFVRTGLSLRLPVRGRANLTLNFGPYVEYRNDYRDRSIEVGLESTLLYQFAPLSSIALRHEIASRRIREYRFGDFGSGIDLLELIRLGSEGVLDSLGTRIGTHTVSLSAVVGTLDVPTDPVRGFVVEPTIAVTVPGDFTSTEYVTAAFRTSGYVPITRSVTLATRFGGGKLWPFGKSVPETQDEGLTQILRLRDALFTAGGASDVRGWSGRLLGPKLPQFILPVEGDSLGPITADRYVPLGGLNLIHGTVELRFPMPGAGPRWGAYTFLDAGRVWTHDERFTDPADPVGVEKLFWAAGVGIDYGTPIGSLRLSLATKLNPSVIDLAEPGETAAAILDGTPLDQLPQHQRRRFQLHIGFGRRL